MHKKQFFLVHQEMSYVITEGMNCNNARKIKNTRKERMGPSLIYAR